MQKKSWLQENTERKENNMAEMINKSCDCS